MRRGPYARRGATLVLNLMAVAIFSILATVVYTSARTQQRGASNDIRQAQALSIAEAGLEDALYALYKNSAWRTGYSSKTFANGFYTVSLSTDTPPRVTSTGYSPSSFLVGRAARTVIADTVFTTGACPYAILADDVEIEGSLDAYDPQASLTPCATCFVDGATVWANDAMTVSGAACPPARVRGSVTVGEGNALTGSAACVEDGVTLSTQTVVLPNWNPTAGANLNINNSDTVTLSPGTYDYQNLTINGVLNLDTSTGTIYINFNANLKANAGCEINNLSKIPSRVRITDVSGNAGHIIHLRCTPPLHAYLEGNANRFNIEQEVYGHYCGGSVKISSATGQVGKVHYDLGGGVLSRVSLKTTPNAWSQTYKRQ